MQITTLMSAISNICQPHLRSILQSVVSRFLFTEEINNMCGANTYLNKLFLEDWRYVYRICLHHQPHNYDGQAIINKDGDQLWYKEGKYHREEDQPAVICANGHLLWYKKGKHHRDGDQPAVFYADGTQKWLKEGKLHRDGDQPAIFFSNGFQKWYKEGTCHRDGGQPAMILSDGLHYYVI